MIMWPPGYSGHLSNMSQYGLWLQQNLTHVPQQTPLSFDHLVGAKQDRLRHRKAERLGGLEVYGHLKLCRKLYREIARLLAAKDAIDIGGGTTQAVYRVFSVGEQAAVSD